MGTTERRQRQKQATREAILAAAREIARNEGWEAVTMRRVAAHIEYTPPVIYEYFQSKDDILAEVQQQGFQLLAEGMRSVSEQEEDSRARLTRMLDIYWQFAKEQPEFYALMHGWESKAVSLEKTFAGANLPAAVVEQALSAWAQSEGFDLPDLDNAVDLTWALLHGMVSIEQMGRVDDQEQRTRRLCQQAFQDLLSVWKVRGRVLQR